MRYEGGQFYVKSEEEMRALFPYAQEALDNTHKIAERCNVEIEFGVTKLPQYDVPDGYTSWEYLQKLCGEGFHKRYPNDDGTLRERLRYELDVIHSMGYVDYFPDCVGFYPFCKIKRYHGRSGTWFGGGQYRRVQSGDHGHRPDPLSADFRAFPEPGTSFHARYRRGFLFRTASGGYRLCGAEIRKDRVVQIVTFGTLAAKGSSAT